MHDPQRGDEGVLVLQQVLLLDQVGDGADVEGVEAQFFPLLLLLISMVNGDVVQGKSVERLLSGSKVWLAAARRTYAWLHAITKGMLIKGILKIRLLVWRCSGKLSWVLVRANDLC